MQVEELRADLADVKHMYREQIDMLVGQVDSQMFVTILWCSHALVASTHIAFIIKPPKVGTDDDFG